MYMNTLKDLGSFVNREICLTLFPAFPIPIRLENPISLSNVYLTSSGSSVLWNMLWETLKRILTVRAQLRMEE